MIGSLLGALEKFGAQFENELLYRVGLFFYRFKLGRVEGNPIVRLSTTKNQHQMDRYRINKWVVRDPLVARGRKQTTRAQSGEKKNLNKGDRLRNHDSRIHESESCFHTISIEFISLSLIIGTRCNLSR